MKKTLVLVRHAHRDTSIREEDNGLSPKGKAQAKWLAESLPPEIGKKPVVILSSKKKRCLETLEPLAKVVKSSVKISPLLIEQEPDEKDSDFVKRIKDFISHWKQSEDPVIIACSHGDWLPLAVTFLSGKAIDFPKGAWAGIFEEDSKAKFKVIGPFSPDI